jgi:hypothetical protein
VCVFVGPERALIDVYLPVLLLLPDSYHWTITGHLSFNQTAMIPIGAFLMARSWDRWQWSFSDLLVLSYVGMTIASEYVNVDYKEAQNVALISICNSILPYIVAKLISPREDLYVDIARRIVICISIVAMLNVYEFRMGRNVFDMILIPFFPGQLTAVWVARYGFLRTAGPYGHAIVAGLIFALGYRLNRWLGWGGYWSGKVPFLPISKTRFCQICLVTGSLMTLSRGPWLGAVLAALVVYFGRARNRTQTITIAAFAILLVGMPLYQAAKSYVWIERGQATSEMQDTAAYRHELIEKYIVIVEERPIWGWGRNQFPTVNGMRSVDNHYLLLALTYGEYVLALFVAFQLWTIFRLAIFCKYHRGTSFPGSLALSLLGCLVAVSVSVTTVALFWQAIQLFFLAAGLSEAVMLGQFLEDTGSLTQESILAFQFKRVMA